MVSFFLLYRKFYTETVEFRCKSKAIFNALPLRELFYETRVSVNIFAPSLRLMKTLTSLPLFIALLLMFSADSGSAQSTPAYPYNVSFILDTAYITHDLNETPLRPDTIHGTIEDFSQFGAFNMTVNISPATQWVTFTTIDGKTVKDGDVIAMTQGQRCKVEIIIIPYADRPDTENYCMTLSLNPTYILNSECIKLTLVKNISAVSVELPASNITLWPNPAGNYITLHGLGGEIAGYRYEIFSISGVKVRHGIVPDDTRISVHDLNSGTYRFLLFDAKQTLRSSAFTVLH